MSPLNNQIDTDPSSELWDDKWGEILSSFITPSSNLNRIDVLSREIDECRQWTRKHFSSLSACDAGRVAGLIRDNFKFSGSTKIRQSVIEMILKELGKMPLSLEEEGVSNVRHQVFGYLID